MFKNLSSKNVLWDLSYFFTILYVVYIHMSFLYSLSHNITALSFRLFNVRFWGNHTPLLKHNFIRFNISFTRFGKVDTEENLFKEKKQLMNYAFKIVLIALSFTALCIFSLFNYIFFIINFMYMFYFCLWLRLHNY